MYCIKQINRSELFEIYVSALIELRIHVLGYQAATNTTIPVRLVS